MHRDLYKNLQAWKNSANRKPLILRGARQVGKTHLLKTFGHKEYDAVFYLNFEQQPQLATLFSEDLIIKNIIKKLTLHFDQEIKPQQHLLIFDEIQECPEALNSLKYFQEEANEYHVVSAGSLLGVRLINDKGFPVGKVNFLDLYPLSFFEFLNAIHKEKWCDFLLGLTPGESIPESIHLQLIQLLKHYLFIGGMPEVVAEYAKSENLLAIRTIQKSIQEAYTLDFAKHAPKEEIIKISEVWASIPNQLARENKKFIFSAIRSGARGREYENAIQWLVDAGLLYKSFLVNTPKLPLTGFADKKTFKLFLLDVGLLSAMSNIPPSILLDDNHLFSEFYGAFTENYVAQALTTQGHSLYYWASPGTAEVDFILENELKILPLEVKAGVSTKKKSLKIYGEKYEPEILLRSSLMNLKKDGIVANCPLYLIQRLFELFHLDY